MAKRNATTTAARSRTRRQQRGSPSPAAGVAASGDISIDEHRADNLVSQMLVIPGKSGDEAAIASFVQNQLRQAGIRASDIKSDAAHRRTPLRGNTGNLVCKLPGTRRGPRRLLMAHLDTVPVCVGAQPVRQGDWIRSGHPQRGIGADDRAGAAVVLHTALEILRQKIPHPPLTFCWMVQEEVGLQGARYLNHGLLGRPRLAFNFDGGAPDKLTIGATGGYRVEIEIQGKASHAGCAPEMGVSAIAIAGIAIADLVRHGWHGTVHKGKRSGTTNIGYIQGGEATNVVTENVKLRAEARSHDATFRKRIVREMEKAFQRAAAQVTNVTGESGRVVFKGHLDYEAFRISTKDPSLLAAERAVHSVGRQPVRTITTGGLDANWMTSRGIPTVSIGAGQLNQHMVTEALDLVAFRDACRIAMHLALKD
ncbi:MAG: M20/M25/M40 family metallo-hydrolase [Pirellulaceae bacterium]|nr:M20/M25/M40 family metallo-hydrolase [Pirellulaceae bacterium]